MCIAQIDIIFVATSLSYITMATRRNSHTNKFKLQAMKLDDDLVNAKIGVNRAWYTCFKPQVLLSIEGSSNDLQ